MKETFQKIGILLIGLALGFMLSVESAPEKVIAHLNPDLRNQVQDLQIQVAVTEGQLQAITGRYNDYGSRLEVIEERMRIFNGGN